ncbi:hypothetical protein AHAS_Ahas05G0082600 [Arachis hypogaea]
MIGVRNGHWGSSIEGLAVINQTGVMSADKNALPGLYSLHLESAEDTHSELSILSTLLYNLLIPFYCSVVEYIGPYQYHSEGVGEGGGDAGGTYVDPKWEFTDDNNSFEDVGEDEIVQHGDTASLSVADLLKHT